MGLISGVFLLLALVVPGGPQPGIPWQMIFGVIWFILFAGELFGFVPRVPR